jgi:hypothetical protein
MGTSKINLIKRDPGKAQGLNKDAHPKKKKWGEENITFTKWSIFKKKRSIFLAKPSYRA